MKPCIISLYCVKIFIHFLLDLCLFKTDILDDFVLLLKNAPPSEVNFIFFIPRSHCSMLRDFCLFETDIFDDFANWSNFQRMSNWKVNVIFLIPRSHCSMLRSQGSN